jgi:CTP synthase (UTP-ammonia lyase)
MVSWRNSGFGERGIEGKIETVDMFVNITYRLGVCLGMQMAVIEYSK